MSDNPPVLTGKRKRAAVNYAELANEDNIIDDFDDAESADEHAVIGDDEDEDGNFSTRRKKITKKAPPNKKAKQTLLNFHAHKVKSKPKKASHFRFLDLPPELRDMIYELALTDANGVSIVSFQGNHRHHARRGRVYAPEAYRPHRWRQTRKVLKDNEQQEISPIETKFIPVILAVNKQINAEAINYLYGHDFVFEDPTALHTFSAMIGPRNLQRLANVTIMAWGKNGVAKGNNHASMTLLASATNLKSLSIMCDVSYYSNRPQWIARRLFRDGHWFFEAYGAANGRKDAVVDILQVSDENFVEWSWANNQNEKGDMSKKQQRFKAELRALLSVKAVNKK